jgi:protein-tyrosine phosphatase
VREVLAELGFGADPVAIDDDGLLYLSPACDDWAPLVQQLELSAVIDLEAGLDVGIPVSPNRVIYVYFPFKDEDVPTLHKLHAVARLGAELVKARERVLVHCQMGLNRSALVAGLVLVYSGVSGKDAVARLQERRPGALYNEVFATYLQEQPAGGSVTASEIRAHGTAAGWAAGDVTPGEAPPSD